MNPCPMLYLKDKIKKRMKRMKIKRPDWDRYWLGVAEAISQRGTCKRRKFGAVIVKDKKIIGTGYCGAPSGTPNCIDFGECLREKYNVPSGKNYNLCRSVHAEMNAIIHADYEKLLARHCIFMVKI